MNGNEAILFWNSEPIACLTSNSINENLSFLATCKTSRKGSSSFIPQTYSFGLSFEAVMSKDSPMSWERVSELARVMQIGNWSITGLGQSGLGYLSNLEIISNSGENITFTGTLTR
jgi:hypothetical protein